MIIGKKRRERLAYQFGVLWYYLKLIDNPIKFTEATECLTALAVYLGLDWNVVNEAARQYEGICKVVDSLDGFEIKWE